MKKLIIITLPLILIAISFANTSLAQVEIGAFGEVIDSNKISEITTINKQNIQFGAANKAERVRGKKDQGDANSSPYRYVSYKIEIMSVDKPIDLDHHIFKIYGDITFNQTKKDGYTYYSGDFSDEGQAKNKLEKIRRVYPKAKIVIERRYLMPKE